MQFPGLLAAVVLAAATLSASAQTTPPAQPPGAIDFTRWEGRWYEVARLPNWSQRHCDPEVVATVLRRTNGDISMIHQCRKTDGSWGVALGYGRFEGDPIEGTLGVRFTPEWLTLPPFARGSFYALALDVDARYALLGSLNRDHLWILSQTRTIDESVYQRAVAQAGQLGYDTAGLIRTVK